MDTFYKIYIQVVFSVKRRQKLILPKFKEELNKYITGIVRNKGHKLLAINGTRDHIHILLSINRDLHLSKLVNEIKTNSSKFINEKRFLRHRFEWQHGYGGSTYSHREISNIIEYIHNTGSTS